MEKRNNNMDPWDPDYYETGSTKPPKSSGGMLALLLIGIILLSGVASAAGLLKMVRTDAVPDTTRGAVSFHEDDEEEPSVTLGMNQYLEKEEGNRPGLELQGSPQSVENIPQEGAKSLQAIYEENIDSVVSITCSLNGGSSSGTGVVLTADGYIVTNAHVVEDAKGITVTLTDGRVLEADVVGADGASDLAVLCVDASDLQPARFGDSSVLRVGDAVVAIGDPLGAQLRGTMTDGIISAINRDIAVDGRTMTLIQTNAALNSGNSGGPLLNCYGQVIGINTMKIGDAMSGAGVEGLGFAIPSTTVKSIVDQLVAQGYVSGRPSLGISVQSIPGFYQRYYGYPAGLYIGEVEADSPAERAGLLAGDILMSFEGQSVPNVDSLSSLLYGYEAGDTVTIVIYRNRIKYTLELTLGEITK